MNKHIYVTKSYKQFSIIDINRKIKPLKVARLKEAMKKKYLGAQYPILVRSNSNNKVKWIIDGQHRFMAAKELKYSVYYIVTDSIGDHEIGDINSLQDKWNLADAMRSHRISGKHDYKVVDQFVTRHNVPVTTAILMLTANKSPDTKAFRDGKFVVTASLQTAEELMQRIYDIKPYFKHAKTRTFIATMKAVTANESYDHRRMIDSIKCQRDKMHKCASRISYMRMIEDVYNFNRQESNRVRFDL